jgi:uncharacterized membrane protein YhfC
VASPAPIAFDPWVAVSLCVSGAIAGFLPVACALVVRRRTGAPWKYLGFGALVFFVSQFVLRLPWQIPLGLWVNARAQGRPLLEWSWLLFSAVGAGVFEEVARYYGYRRLCRDERSYRVALMYGVGHGGFESIALVGLSMAGALVTYVLYTHGMLPTAGVPPEQLAALRAQMAGLTPLTALVGGVERIFALCIQVGFSVVVLQAFLRDDRRWLWGAIAGHAAVDFIAVALLKLGGILAAEAGIAALALCGVYALRRLRPVPATPSA